MNQMTFVQSHHCSATVRWKLLWNRKLELSEHIKFSSWSQMSDPFYWLSTCLVSSPFFIISLMKKNPFPFPWNTWQKNIDHKWASNQKTSMLLDESKWIEGFLASNFDYIFICNKFCQFVHHQRTAVPKLFIHLMSILN